MEPQMPDPVPSIMRWRFKQLKKLLKETVTRTPNNGQATVKPGQRIIVDLPFNSTVDLGTFCHDRTVDPSRKCGQRSRAVSSRRGGRRGHGG